MSRLPSSKTAQIWAEHIAQCERSNVPTAQFCQSIGCSLTSCATFNFVKIADNAGDRRSTLSGPRTAKEFEGFPSIFRTDCSAHKTATEPFSGNFSGDLAGSGQKAFVGATPCYAECFAATFAALTSAALASFSCVILSSFKLACRTAESPLAATGMPHSLKHAVPRHRTTRRVSGLFFQKSFWKSRTL